MMGWDGKKGMWFARRGHTFMLSTSFERAWYFAAGYGVDQAAGLRYLMDMINGCEK